MRAEGRVLPPFSHPTTNLQMPRPAEIVGIFPAVQVLGRLAGGLRRVLDHPDTPPCPAVAQRHPRKLLVPLVLAVAAILRAYRYGNGVCGWVWVCTYVCGWVGVLQTLLVGEVRAVAKHARCCVGPLQSEIPALILLGGASTPHSHHNP